MLFSAVVGVGGVAVLAEHGGPVLVVCVVGMFCLCKVVLFWLCMVVLFGLCMVVLL